MSARYGVMGEFAEAEKFVEAARTLRGAGLRLEAYAPFSVDGLAEALALRNDRIAPITFAGGVAGGVAGYVLQWYTAVIDYPIDAGGRPLHAWPAFIPATFEMAVLGAALAAFFGFLVLNGLPRLRHPVFDAPDFDLASRDRFFLCVLDASDCDGATRRLLDAGAKRVVEVPR